ncbi:GNAT family N-acetyltransferase [Micropruina glycogenica]|uniref:Phosphinothricin N-acetyltransferase n=1 Tax=Micropruina glycogenica TaxID=75385 RepID=A0A2N9JE12_9ACTN|nr:GNAT family N-acetyltransferase [Micropruina glycogenica]SPD86357.1 Phosphinothricin N-acetyltransferase [Micropruina glycogenica]
MLIRAAQPSDLAAVAAIYAHEVEQGTATFDTTPPDQSSWEHKASDTTPGHHLLVAVQDDRVLGFAYSVTYRPRGAYAQTKETSIYLAEGAQGRGVGSTLYAALLDRLRDDDVYTVIAVIASPNPASAALHRSLGFEQAGVLRRVGYKFGRRIDTEFWQLLLD